MGSDLCISDSPITNKNSRGRRIKSAGKIMKERYDINGMQIGDGSWHNPHTIFDFGELPVTAHVEKSVATESVYVTYTRTDISDIKAKVRFSNHTCNDIRYGEVIDGNLSEAREHVLVKLGFMRVVKTPRFAKHIAFNSVALKKIKTGAVELLPISIDELYDKVNVGESLEDYFGKAVMKNGQPVVITSKIVGSREIPPVISFEMI